MSSLLGTRETVARLNQLRAALQEFAGREEKIESEFRLRTAAEQKAFEADSESVSVRSAETVAQADAAFRARKEQARLQFEKRKARISHGHMESRRRAMDAIHGQEGKRKYKVQEGTLNAEKRQENALTAADAALKEFNDRLAESQHRLAQLGTVVRFAFSGYGAITRMFSREIAVQPESAPDPEQLLHRADELQSKISRDVEQFRKVIIPKLFRFVPLGLSVMLLLAGAVMLSPLVKNLPAGVPWQQIGLGTLIVGLIMLIGRIVGGAQAKPVAEGLATDLAKAQALQNVAFDRAQQRHHQEQERARDEFEQTKQQLNQEWKKAVKEGIDLLDLKPRKIDEQAQRVMRRNEESYQRKVKLLEQGHPTALEQLRREGELANQSLRNANRERLSTVAADREAKLDALAAEWNQRIDPILQSLEASRAEAQQLFPDWGDEVWKTWAPPRQFVNAARFAQLEVKIAQLSESAPKHPSLALSASSITVPLLLTYPREGSLLIETSAGAAGSAMALINSVIFRLLATTPPGKLSFTIFDPVGLGQNFAGLMHLADYEESHINSRIWTQANHLEEKLAELNEHMEKVIQMYLRNEYPTISEYNAQAGTIAEKYHFLIIADFPVNFSDVALRRLINIVSNGARCGVYTLIHWDQRQPLPPGFVPDELRRNCIGLIGNDRGFSLAEGKLPGTQLVLDVPPAPARATPFLHAVGESSRDSNRVEVPFSHVAPSEAEIWSEETAEELRVPIGRSGATKFQYLEIGKGTRQHALIAGKTGSGKSTLFHIIITNLALWCSPEEVEFYLVDFKKGVEFKSYAVRRLPHARVVAIESDRQFGLSVLQRVDEELRRRGDLFRDLGVQDVAGYRRAKGKEPMPRSLLLIDEFQEFFTEEDRVSQGAAVLLDRIVRQGRAFGIHVVLGSQTLGGAYTLARATIGQMVIRIALQCNEADAYLIMDQDNPAPRLLSRPGEGIYNDAAGSIEGNSPFQAVWLAEDERDRYLGIVRERASRSGKNYPGPFVFEGNAPAEVRENSLLRGVLEAKPSTVPASARVWLGAPNLIKGPTEAVFQRQGGNNLLIVGQSEERASTLLGLSLLALAAQYPKGIAKFILLGSGPSGQSEFLDRVSRLVPDVVQVKPGELAETMSRLADELKASGEAESGNARETFVLIQGLQNFKKLRAEDEFSFSSSTEEGVQPAAVLQSLISEGPAHGFHVIISCDSYNNVNRFLGRKMLSEFEMRVLFQMSANDSASLIDEPDASTLGLNRAIYYNDREGYLETFRPYALPDREWVDEAGKLLGNGVER